MKTWKRSIKIAGLWFTLSNTPVKKRNSRKADDRNNIDSTYRMKDIRREIRARKATDARCAARCRNGWSCIIFCPSHAFPNYGTTAETVVALCHDCHKEIHCNPWANIRMMEAKAAELGFDLGERYDTRLKY